ncbi:MAG: DUF1080 domain-containing protein [Planctomycetota bacterium]|nr:DUF1080 domain-containing protein [Planctomycetota bacterium]
MLLTIMLSCLCARPPGETPQIPEQPPVTSQSPSPAAEPAIDNQAYPSECLVETRRDGLLLTFNEPLPENGTQDQVSLSLAADLTDNQIVDPPMIQGVVKSPDGRRAFFHIPTFVLGSKFNITITSTSWPEPILAQVDAGTPHLNSTGPDFAASCHPILPALDRKPPADSLVLFDGTDLDQFIKRNGGGKADWLIEDDTLLVNSGKGDLLTRMPLSDGLYHVEWLSPPGGDPASQKNGNSGVKFEERYELQILNNAGHPRAALINESGSIYRLRAADVNASMGPGQWQSYHVWYTAPRWEDGQKTTDARMTVYWNDVLVHDDVPIPSKTGASIEEGPDPRRLLLQDHASSTEDEVRYRNVWHVPAAQLPTSLQPPAVQSTTSPGAKQ